MPLKQLLTKKLATKVGKTAVGKSVFLYEMWLRLIGRGLQLIFALVVIGLYGTKVHADADAGTGESVRWVFAVIVASLSAIVAVLFAIPQPFVRTARLFYVDFTIFILYIAVFGTFAITFLRIPNDAAHETYDGAKVSTMRHAVWIDLLNALFWLFTGGYGFFRTFVSRKADKMIDEKLDQLEKGVMSNVDNVDQKYMGGRINAASEFGSKHGVVLSELPQVAKKWERFPVHART
ncbi:hypothetical protein F5Y16DRAFT_197668 [Xylariaceae sp. FL0255]|nr:hypothetical protein F5Y16DRAFT_197668 [Xylariaceae sp. FL0255]